MPNDPIALRPQTTATTTATDRGQKRRCTKCSAPFYDLRRDPIVCPKCGAKLVSLLPQRHERPRPTPTGRDAEPVVVTTAEAAAEDDTDADEADDTDADEADDVDAEPDAELADEPDDENEPSEPGKSDQA